MAYIIGLVLGAVMITALLSRLALWLTKWIKDARQHVHVSHALSFILATVVGGLGAADGGPPRFGFAAATYLLPQLFWWWRDLKKLDPPKPPPSQSDRIDILTSGLP